MTRTPPQWTVWEGGREGDAAELGPRGWSERLRRLAGALATGVRNGVHSFREYYASESDPLSRDPLTRTWNRRRFERRRAGLRSGYALLLIDIDDFKRINDRFGHAMGDEVLAAVGRSLRQASGDAVYRVGGEEFAVLLSGCALHDAVAVGERLRGCILALPALHGARISVSVGVVSALPGDDADAVYRMADRALYMAKRLGKNRVVVGQRPHLALGA